MHAGFGMWTVEIDGDSVYVGVLKKESPLSRPASRPPPLLSSLNRRPPPLSSHRPPPRALRTTRKHLSDSASCQNISTQRSVPLTHLRLLALWLDEDVAAVGVAEPDVWRAARIGGAGLGVRIGLPLRASEGRCGQLNFRIPYCLRECALTFPQL